MFWGQTFESVKNLFERMRRGQLSTGASTKANGNQQLKPKLVYPGTPIIVVPATVSALLTNMNVKEFLEEGTFIPNEIKRKSSAKRNPVVELDTASRKGIPKAFKVVDNVTRFSEKDWRRVVAVFVHGPEWQFKEWKWSLPTEIFQHVLGVNIRFSDEKPDPNVSKWGVKKMTIHRQKRHLDKVASNEYWKELGNFIKLKRREFLQSSEG